ncbi:Benzaldehyde dehydrogenase (NAD(+)) [Folsomia candida]|uniref:Benzaldehyde dehydrogenase (NAD(+)) n=1 Tax=Folsomia candida TaxID=158441 RepID=A0A226D3S7_FOLCA|nr:Benzaldehyde dehydrogenase (NAD(+)) [Folsomia candida]
MRSGADNLIRGISKGLQTFEQEMGDSPLYKPIRKIEAIHQTSGEAEYIADLPTLPNELFGAFLLSKAANATLRSIDATQALVKLVFFVMKKLPGVVQFFQAKDVPGTNNYMEFGIYAGPPSTPAKTVVMTSFRKEEPTLSTEVVKMNEANKYALNRSISGKGGADIFKRLYDLVKYSTPTSQTNEHANSNTPPVDTVFVQKQVSYYGQALGLLLATSKEAAYAALSLIKVEYENVQKPKIGLEKLYRDAEKDGVLLSEHSASPGIIRGSFKNGRKYHYHMELQSCLCILREACLDVYAGTQWMDHTQYVVASVLNIPHNKVNVQVRRLGGGFGAKLTRNAAVSAACALAAYHTGKPVDVTNNGKIVSLDANIACGTGFTSTESHNAAFCIPFVQNAYACDGWKLTPLNFTSNTASSVRGPGSVNGDALIENIMDHIAFTLKKDPLDVRSVNYAAIGDSYITSGNITDENKIPIMMQKILADSNYRAKFTVFIAIYHFDGTVAVSHLGIEMGQGINTKVGQTVAHALGISIDFIQFKPSNNLTGANSFLSGASFTSELCCYGALKACEILKTRMAPYQDASNPLSQNPNDEVGSEPSVTETIQYPVWIVCAAEVEIDVLTGENRIIRVDILQDVGKSSSPHVDIGQIKGAFVMGLGFFTTEEIIHDETTGELLTTRSWDAIYSARRDAGCLDWFRLDTPVTPEDIVRSCLVEGTRYEL